MEHTWRWFGPADPISLAEIRQTGATGIVTALHHIPNGDVWTLDEILQRKAVVEDAGLRWSVVESVPVHEHIKWGGPEKDRALENYGTSIRNLAAAGLDTVAYNFMPVLDWTRTDLRMPLETGGNALAFSFTDYAAFDRFILQRESTDYDDDELARAEQRFAALTADEIERLTRTILAGLPGAEESFTLASFRDALDHYASVDAESLRAALFSFIAQIAPIAEEHGVRLAIHPDDPPRPLFGLPRVVSSAADIQALLDSHASVANGITLCVGSMASDPDNDASDIARRFAARTYFAHLRNVTAGADRKSFFEADHLGGDVDMVDVIGTLLREEDRRTAAGESFARIPMRPDHGQVLLDDRFRDTRPGYPLIGRMRGLAQLSGVELAVRRSLDRGAA